MITTAAPETRSHQDHALVAQNALLRELLRQAGVESAARDVADEIQRVLTEEIHHRIKNILTMVTAIVRQSVAAATDLPGAEIAITARLLAMAKAQDLLLKSDWHATGLIGVMTAATALHTDGETRITVTGDDVEIAPATILPLTLILNELGTNATKYGALSIDSGHVLITLTRDDVTRALTLVWQETGGPPVVATGAKSFGTRLIERALPRQIGGEGTLAFLPEGVTYTLTIPLEALQHPAA
jgi:two-component sensor histidine kinase